MNDDDGAYWALIAVALMLAAVVAVFSAVRPAHAAQRTGAPTVLGFMVQTVKWSPTSPPAATEGIFTSVEGAHVYSIVGRIEKIIPSSALTADDGASTLTTDNGASPLVVKAAAQQTYYAVPAGLTCGPTNGPALLATDQYIDAYAAPGSLQRPALSATPFALPTNSTLCAVSAGDFSGSQGVVTIKVGP